MRIEALADADSVARAGAAFTAAEARAAVAARGRFIVGISGGHTPWKMLRALAGGPAGPPGSTPTGLASGTRRPSKATPTDRAQMGTSRRCERREAFRDRRAGRSWFLCRPPRYHEVADGDLYWLAVLVQRRRSHLEQSLVRPRSGRPHLEHFTLDAQLVPGPHGPGPTELVEAGADDPPGGLQIAFDQQPHGDRGGVPTARSQSAEARVARNRLGEMERLRIELGGEGFDPLRVERHLS